MDRKKGSLEGFTEAYMEYYPVVFSSILTKVSNKDDASDICQEVFMAFYDKFETIENKRAWLYGTTRNIVFQYYKKKDQNVNMDDVFADMSLAFTNGFRDTRIIINKAIEEIECDDDDRVILDLVATYNFSYTHVAKVLGFTRRQIEYRYGMLVKKILNYLRDRGIKDIEELL